MANPDFRIKILRIVYEGIYEDHIEVELIPLTDGEGELAKEIKIYRVSVGGALQGKRIAKMKQCPSMSIPPYATDGDLPREFEAEVKLQIERL